MEIKDNSSKVKIFVIYHKKTPIYENEVFTPIQSGSELSDVDLGILKDNTGDNISYKNTHYAELTANYWVWKNYLQLHPEVEYIGFCHYRRFLDFNKPTETQIIQPQEFSKIFPKEYTKDIIYNTIKDYDIIFPPSIKLPVYNQYCKDHPKKDIDILIEIIRRDYPEMVEDMEKVLFSETFDVYFCLNYVMKKELFVEFMNWTFDIISKLEEQSDWSEYTEYLTIKTPAYLIERFINVWLQYKLRISDIKILTRRIYMLCEQDKKTLNIFPGISYTTNKNKRAVNILGIKFAWKLPKKSC